MTSSMSPPDPPRFERAEVFTTGGFPAQESWRVVREGRERARLSLWWRHTPPWPGERLGTIGDLAAGDPREALPLLQWACERLAQQGCRRVLAPMDGNSWGTYRCRLDAPLGFVGEPAPGPDWLPVLEACGFQLQSRYVSHRCDDLAWRRLPDRVQRRLAGLKILRGGALEAPALLPRLHRLVMEAFAAQPWFLPLPSEAFAAAVRGRLGAEAGPFHWLALDGEEPVGLLLAQRQHDQLVLRTLAVRPGHRFAGLGCLLLERAHAAAAAAGCRSALHVLMQDPGPSQRLSRHYGRPVARYGLLGRRLEPPAGPASPPPP